MSPRSFAFWAVILMASVLVVVGCGGGGPASTPPGSSGSAVEPSAAVASPGNAVDAVPTACYGLGDADCRRVVHEVAALLTSTDSAVRYIQVGPFGCQGEAPCPTTLVARPEGDVTFESGGTAVSFHVSAAGGALEAVRQESFGIALGPTTTPPPPGHPQPFTLGHCGLWSGIDLGGSWWDPIGYVDANHPDSINAAEGSIVFTDRDHALFTSRAGLVVGLLRRDGEKYLPFCD